MIILSYLVLKKKNQDRENGDLGVQSREVCHDLPVLSIILVLLAFLTLVSDHQWFSGFLAAINPTKSSLSV